MGLFDRDYDREYGYRGSTGYRGGYDRSMRGRTGSWWERTKDKMGVGNDYDRGYGYDRNYGRGTGYGTAGYGTAGYGAGRYGTTRYGTTGYDRTYGRTAGYADDYGAGYKSRAQTDAGDPFGDRQSGTPIRVMEERDRDSGWKFWKSDYDHDQRYDTGYRTGYDRSYGYGVGHDAYGGRSGYGTTRRYNEYEGQHRTGGARGYDRGLRGSAQYAWRETKDETSEALGRDRGYGGRANRGYDRGWF